LRRRLDLAASLIGRPEVVFLDEPTTGLDPRSRQATWRIVSDLAASGVTVFLTTQYLEEADSLADRIAVLDRGTIVAEGTARELKQRVAGQRLDLELVDPSAFERVRSQLGDRAIRAERSTLTVAIPVDGEATKIRTLLDELDRDHVFVVRFSLVQASLDDVFMSLTERRVDRNEPETTNV
jgi:ABC-2 type transport system ATP-binding protein